MSHTRLHRLAELCGIQSSYWDIHGQEHFTSDETRRGLLEAMGHPCATDEEIESQILECELAEWRRITPPVLVVRQDRLPISIDVHLPASELSRRRVWIGCLESGKEAHISFCAEECEELEEREVDGVLHKKLRCWFSEFTELGYHWLQLVEDENPEDEFADDRTTLLIVTPPRCYQPEGLALGKRVWGISAQLYSLRSATERGIGTFAELRELCARMPELGADAVGLSPLHAVTGRGGGEYSPYAPSSRSMLNALYLDVEQAATWLGVSFEPDRQGEIHDQDGALIDYPSIASRQFSSLERLYDSFLESLESKREDEFVAFVESVPHHQYCFALYHALQEHFLSSDSDISGWHQWPQEYQQPESEAVLAFADSEPERVAFYLFIEWLLEQQLTEIAESCRSDGLAIGLYLDLALGARSSGADVWMNQDLYAQGVSMGAPPDELAPQGQDWGLPPLAPRKLRMGRYEPFIDAVRFNMRWAGALRIDHVMSLFRLFWVLPHAGGGAYVRYSVDDLFGIVALESLRNECLVIGEDLGTVPDEVRAAMEDRGVLSYKVLMFMKESADSFVSPDHYPDRALVVVSTHDLPTMRGYWESSDIDVREKLELHPTEVLEQLRQQRETDRWAMGRAFHSQQLATAIDARQIGELARAKDAFHELNLAAHMYLAMTKSHILMVQLEDLLEQASQMNLPGTTDEHPNWRRRLEQPFERLFSSPAVQEVLAKVDSLRNSG